eukprot:768457-Hanusia_phi.AAC.7
MKSASELTGLQEEEAGGPEGGEADLREDAVEQLKDGRRGFARFHSNSIYIVAEIPKHALLLYLHMYRRTLLTALLHVDSRRGCSSPLNMLDRLLEQLAPHATITRKSTFLLLACPVLRTACCQVGAGLCSLVSLAGGCILAQPLPRVGPSLHTETAAYAFECRERQADFPGCVDLSLVEEADDHA